MAGNCCSQYGQVCNSDRVEVLSDAGMHLSICSSMSTSVADLGNLYLQIGQFSMSLYDGTRDSTGGLRAGTVGRFGLLSTVPKEDR